MTKLNLESRSLVDRIERASEFTIHDKALIKYYITHLGRMKLKSLGKGYKEMIIRKKFEFLYSTVGITEKEEMESISIYKYLCMLDKELAHMTNVDDATSVIYDLLSFFIGYPYKGHDIGRENIKGNEMEIIGGYVRLSAPGSLKEISITGGKNAEVNLIYFLSKENRIKIRSTDDIGCILNIAFDYAENEKDYSDLSENSAITPFYNKSLKAKQAYLILKNLLIDPVMIFCKPEDNEDIFTRLLAQ